jgi:hypothetical protein
MQIFLQIITYNQYEWIVELMLNLPYLLLMIFC